MMPWGLVFITAFGFLVYVVLIGMDRLTFKAPRQNIEVGESEL